MLPAHRPRHRPHRRRLGGRGRRQGADAWGD